MGGRQTILGGKSIDLSNNRLEAMFKEADTEKCGHISTDQMKRLVLAVHGKRMRKKDLAHVMAQVARSSDAITLQQFKAAMHAGPKEYRGVILYSADVMMDGISMAVFNPVTSAVLYPLTSAVKVVTAPFSKVDIVGSVLPMSAPPMQTHRVRHHGWVWHDRWAKLTQQSAANARKDDDAPAEPRRAAGSSMPTAQMPLVAQAPPRSAILSSSKKAGFIERMSRAGLTLGGCPVAAQGDRDIVLAAVRNNGHALQFASDAVCADREVVETAICHSSGLALAHASSELRSNRSVVLIAVRLSGRALRYASEELRDDGDVVSKAVGSCGMALEYASTRLQADRDLVLGAVRDDGHALAYAAARLRADRDVVLAAVSRQCARASAAL